MHLKTYLKSNIILLMLKLNILHFVDNITFLHNYIVKANNFKKKDNSIKSIEKNIIYCFY